MQYSLYNDIVIVTSKPQDSIFYGKFRVFEGSKKERSSSPHFLSVSQVTLVRARATNQAHLCKAPDCGSTSDLRAL